MIYIILTLAIICMIIGHYYRVYRLKYFIGIYEKPNVDRLLQALSFSYVINIFMPFHLGDIFRAWWSSRYMKNGFLFSLAIIIIDRILDIFVVAIIFMLFYIFGFQNPEIQSSIYFYIIGGSLLFLFLAISYKFNIYTKLLIRKTAKIFNEDIELNILRFLWYIIITFKNLVLRLNKRQLLKNTIIMWFFYIVSYVLYAATIRYSGSNISLIEIFILLFSKDSFDASTLNILSSNIYIIIYLLTPLLILMILPLITIKIKKKDYNNNQYLQLISQQNKTNELHFLEDYFSTKSREYLNNYIMLCNDISIIQDFSSGSNATTLLCIHNKKMLFRKYVFGDDSIKLYNQIIWIQEHQEDIPLTQVLNIKKGDGYCSYDMPYIKDSIKCFNYIHSIPINKSWLLLRNIIEQLSQKLYIKNIKKSDNKTINKYIEDKVLNNLVKIQNAKYIKPLLKYDRLIINGQKYHNLNYFKKFLTKEYLGKLFSEDIYSDIHGDLTIDNIICLNNKSKNNFYIIDPNTDNIHNSPNLDYAKLLQSLHSNYEFLMNAKIIKIHKNNITYILTKSTVYDSLYNKYDKYLTKKFDELTLKSIYFHEIIHWLRLLPYKIQKEQERQVLFYANFIVVLNEIIERFCDEK